MALSNDDLVKILEARFEIAPNVSVSIADALRTIYQIPAQTWSHQLPRTVGKGQVSTGDLLRYESAEHANTRAVVEAVVKVVPGADVDAIAKAVRDTLAAGVNVNITTGGTP